MPRHAPVPLSEVDLDDIDGFADERGYAQFDTLRAESPVHWTPEENGKGFWSVTRYEDIWTVDRDAETFTSTKFVNLEDIEDDLADARRSLLETDGVRHTALRHLIHREFSPRNLMKNYEAFLRELTKETVDRAFATARENDGRIDFVKMISADFPIQVLARLLDVPAEMTPQLIAWGNEMVANTDPDYATIRLDDPESEQYKHLPFRSPTVLDVWAYGNELRESRIGGEGIDLVSILANKMPQDGVPLSQEDFNNYFSLLVIAGNETTRHAISQSMLGLLEQRDQLELLAANPELMDTAVEELLRWASPVLHFRRTATRDVEISGQPIKEGDKVVMWFASGNRDERVFEDPYKIDVTRTNVDHMTFGKGSPHLCLGNNLARLEIKLMFQELLPRLAEIELDGDVKRVRSNFVNGIKKFPVRIVEKS